MVTWHPIRTCPVGKPVLMYAERNSWGAPQTVFAGLSRSGGVYEASLWMDGNHRTLLIDPTHWAPMPDPPKKDAP